MSIEDNRVFITPVFDDAYFQAISQSAPGTNWETFVKELLRIGVSKYVAGAGEPSWLRADNYSSMRVLGDLFSIVEQVYLEEVNCRFELSPIAYRERVRARSIYPPLPSMPANGIFVVYRHFDEDGALLYVGYSSSVRTRQRDHRMQSHWWNLIAQFSFEEFESNDLALAAELKAIHEEHPLYNIVGRSRS